MISSAAWPEKMSDHKGPDELDGTIRWAELLQETAMSLRLANVDNPAAEAKWMVEQATGTTGAECQEILSSPATVRGVNHLESMIRRRCDGEPIQYVLGSWSFRMLDLLVDERVLIPRPETEMVAGLALDELDRMRPDGGGTVIDLGTGSGAIGLSVAAERNASRVLLTDKSADALAVARANLAGLGLAARGVEISQGSWFEAVPERFLGECDVIVSNPPYVPLTDDLATAVADWEPLDALFSGDDGLDDLRNLIAGVARWLRPSGALVLEMDPRQIDVVSDLLASERFSVEVHADHAGHSRAIVARLI